MHKSGKLITYRQIGIRGRTGNGSASFISTKLSREMYMRRKEREIVDKNEIIDFINSRYVGILSVMSDDGPYAIPLNYFYDDGCIYVHSAMNGKKIDSIKKDNRVCFLVYADGPQILHEKACGISQIYKSVICFGNIEIVSAFDSKKDILIRMVSKIVPEEYNYSSMKDENINSTNIMRIRIKKMTGKENKLSSNHTVIDR